MAKVILTLQIYNHDAWADAAELQINDPARGVQSPTTLSYFPQYFAEVAAVDFAAGVPVVDNRACSVLAPVDLEYRVFDHWPSFMLDLMPQGHARQKLAMAMNLNPDVPETELPLLIRGGGAPIGNLRIKEAYEAERERLRGQKFEGLTVDHLLNLEDEFLEIADRYALIASGSSGVQGEWPKVLMTEAGDGLWYPDPFVPDEEAVCHAIIKISRNKHKEDTLILNCEKGYLEIARAFGLDVAAPLIKGRNMVLIPRFDRRGIKVGSSTQRFGQESLVSALGVAQFGHRTSHEVYIEAIKAYSTNPKEDIIEYVLRDVLNLALGNPDNHGRNTAFCKKENQVRLTPLFDFAPMSIDPGGVGRVTRWSCLEGAEIDPDWAVVCEAAFEDPGDQRELLGHLKDKAAFLDALAGQWLDYNLPIEAKERALKRLPIITDSLRRA